jgi:hypothetical protein
MSETNHNQPGPLGSMIFGSIFFLVGAFIVLLAADVIHSDPSYFNAPRWVVGAAGAVFMLAGTLVALSGVYGPNPEQSRTYMIFALILGTALMLLFSSIFIWVGFGPGEREFSTSTSVGAVTTTSSGGDSGGRLVFGGSGLFILLMTFFMARANWKKIRDFDG